MKEVLTIHVERTNTGLFVVTCDQHKGLLGVERSLAEAVASVIPALRELLAAGPPHPNPHVFDGIDLSEPKS